MSAEEDQLAKIKNLLQTLTASQIHTEALASMPQQEISERQQETRERKTRVDNEMAELRATLDRTDQQIARTAAMQEATELQLQKFINDTAVRFGKLERRKP